MTGRPLSLVLLSTGQCNAACDYCFERKDSAALSLDQLSLLMERVLTWMGREGRPALDIYWQGGEAMLLPPAWYRRAHGVVARAAAPRGISVTHYLQSNLIAYGASWDPVIARVFGHSVGSSMDFPNLYRKLPRGGAEAYTAVWSQHFAEARARRIQVGIIALPNEQTLALGAARFYRWAKELGIQDLQLNTPFPGGASSRAKQRFPLDADRLARFLLDLADLWAEYGDEDGITINPFAQLVAHFRGEDTRLPCIWQDNCTNHLLCIDANGNVAQCDCWVTSYPEFRFGNVFEADSLADLLGRSHARHLLRDRPGEVISREDCLACAYLSICHGGCPVRAYSVFGEIARKDPYCQVYRALFAHCEQLARRPVPPSPHMVSP
jgi:uncharacterized protein